MPIKKRDTKKERPSKLKVVSVIVLINLVLTIIMSLFYIILGFSNNLSLFLSMPVIGESMKSQLSTLDPTAQMILPAMFAGIGIFMLAWAIFNLYVLKLLNKGKNWARIFFIVIFIISVVFSLFSVPGYLINPKTMALGVWNLIWLLLEIYIVLALFSDDVKKFCK